MFSILVRHLYVHLGGEVVVLCYSSYSVTCLACDVIRYSGCYKADDTHLFSYASVFILVLSVYVRWFVLLFLVCYYYY